MVTRSDSADASRPTLEIGALTVVAVVAEGAPQAVEPFPASRIYRGRASRFDIG